MSENNRPPQTTADQQPTATENNKKRKSAVDKGSKLDCPVKAVFLCLLYHSTTHIVCFKFLSLIDPVTLLHVWVSLGLIEGKNQPLT